MTPPPRAYQDPLETWSEKAKRKFNENPWVPIGCLATCGALVMSAVKMRQGQSKQMNYWMRARVALQGITLVVLVSGSLAIQEKRALEQENAAAAAGGIDALEQLNREQERREFEERLREAEDVTAMEANAGLTGMKTVKGPSVNHEKRDEERRKAEAQMKTSAPGATTAAVKESNSWKWWSSKDSN